MREQGRETNPRADSPRGHMHHTDQKILALLGPDIQAAKNYQRELSREREEFYKRYRAEPYNNERKGWAETVHPTIFSTVEWMKPGLVDVFTGDFFQLKPVSRAGEDPKQAQERAHRLKQYIRFKLFSQLDGEQIIEDFIHDCLTCHYGVFKVAQRDEWDVETVHTGVASQEELARAQESDPAFVEARAGSVRQELNPVTRQPSNVYEDVTVVRKVQRYKGPSLEVVPARELYMLPGYADLQKNPFVAHVVKRDLDYVRRQELAGVYRPGSWERVKGKVDARPENPETMGEQQAQAMVDNLTSGILASVAAKSDDPMKISAGEVWLWECYVRLDMDGSGLLKPCIVTLCEDVVLREPVENPYGGPPFELGYVYKEPHKIIGRPVPAILDSRQRVMTNLLRCVQDAAAVSTYRNTLTTDPRIKTAIADMGPGDVGYVSSLSPNSLMTVDPGSPSNFIFDAFQLTAQEVAKETGVNENQQGLDANSLNRTAAGMEMRLTAGMQRQRLYAKRIARTFKRVLRRVMDIMRHYPPEDDVNAVGVDLMLSPEDVSGLYSVDIDVGVGPQDRAYYAQGLDQLINWQCQVGIPMGVVTPDMVLKTILAKYEYLDMDVSEYLPPPDNAPGMAAMRQAYQQAAGENTAMKQSLEQARYQDALQSEQNRLKELQIERDYTIKARELFIKEQEMEHRRQAQAQAAPQTGMDAPGQETGADAGEDGLGQAIAAQAMQDLARINSARPVPAAPPINVALGPAGPLAQPPPGAQQQQPATQQAAVPPQPGTPKSALPR